MALTLKLCGGAALTLAGLLALAVAAAMGLEVLVW